MSDENVHEIQARKATLALKAVEAMIPRLQHVDLKQQKAFRAMLNVPRPFLQAAAAMAVNGPAAESSPRITPEQTLDVFEYLNAYLKFRNELEVMLKRVDYSMQAAQAQLAQESLLVYAVAKAHARRGNPEVRIKVAQMRHLLGRRGPKRRKKAAEAAEE